MKRIPQFCSRHPYLIILLTVVSTFLAFKAITLWLYVEPDLTKFLPKDYATIKSDDYYRQNYNHQDFVLVGIEADTSVWDLKVMRYMENIIEGFKGLTATKTFDSLITGKAETVTLPIGIDIDNIQSIANLEDVILDEETGAMLTGRIVRTIKEELGIPSKPGMDERLPESDADLERVIPILRAHVMADPLFRGNIVSEDGHAAMIQVPMQRKWDFMRRYVRDEIGVALSEETLTRRFKGEFTDFPHNIWGQSLDEITVNEKFVADQVAHMKAAIQPFLAEYYAPVFDEYPQLQQRIASELTPENFAAIMSILEDKDLYQNPNMQTWETSTNDFYVAMREAIDPLARDNMEFQIHDPRQFVELGYNANELQRVLDENATEGINAYITGYEYIIALLSRMMGADMAKMVPLAVLVDIIVLAFFFRSVRGVVIPIVPTFLAMIFTMASMAVLGVPLSLTTFIIPIVLLAVGTAYQIHILNRYHEDMFLEGGRIAVLKHTYLYVGAAVFFAGITTAAGFSSLAYTDLRLIMHFGVFSALGVGWCILFAFVLTPAMLALWPSPLEMHAILGRLHTAPVWKRIVFTILLPLSVIAIWRGPGPVKEPFSLAQVHSRGTLLDKFLNMFGNTVVRHHKLGLAITAVLAVGATYLAFGNYFESGIIYNFKKDNPIYISDHFINRHLSGTYSISLLFKFRDEVLVDRPEMQSDLQGRVDKFSAAWERFAAGDSALRFAPFNTVVADLAELDDRPQQNLGGIRDRLAIITDTLNEEYRVTAETASGASGIGAQTAVLTGDDEGGLDDLDDLDILAEDGDGASGGGGDTELIAGLADLRSRMAVTSGRTERADRFITAVRNKKNSARGNEMQYAFNYLTDFFAVDVKQPAVLKKLEVLESYMEGLQEPMIDVDGYQMPPIGNVIQPTDIFKKIYRVLYHDGDLAYDKLPEPRKDGLPDPTITERSVLGTVVNQAISSDRDSFNRAIVSELNEFRFLVLSRAGESRYIIPLIDIFQSKADELFPPDDPYIEKMTLAGRSPRSMEITLAIANSQGASIAMGVLLVGFICMLLFRSVTGGIYCMIPLALTILFNFAVINLMGFAITVMVMIVAAIAIGTGVDYTIHFLERFKIQIAEGDDPIKAYMNTIHTSGKAIFYNAVSVALGFSVLIASDFKGNIQMGILMIGTMMFASMAALTTLPALIFLLNPKFLQAGKIIEVN